MKIKTLITLLITIALLLLLSTVSYSSGTMEYSYKNGRINIWGEGVQTTYADHGYNTILSVDGSEIEILNGSGTLDGVTCRINLSCVSNNNYVKISYKVTNNSSETKIIGVASHADIQIGSNDYAPITNLSGNRGFTMSGDGHLFKFLGRDTYGVVNVDTYWFGQYQIAGSNRWNTSYTFDYGGGLSRKGDSGMAYSWKNRTLRPGATLDLSVLIGIGDINNPPTITANNFAKNEYYPGERVNVFGTVNDRDSGDRVQVRYAVDGGTELTIASGIIPNGVAKPYNTTFVVPMVITAGRHYVDVWAVDSCGDMSPSIRVYFNVVVDITPPTGEHKLNPNTWTNQNVTITVTAKDSETGVKGITLPNNRFMQSSKVTYVVSENGTYTFKLEDNAGNIRNYKVSVTNIDRIKPSITLSEPNKDWTAQNIDINFSVADMESGIQKVILPDGREITSSQGSYTIIENGIYKFIVYDNAGNSKNAKITVGNIDKIKPNLELNARKDWVPDRVNIMWQGSDSKSGFSKIKLPDGTYNTSSTGEYEVTENGTYTFICYDNVGNEQTKTIPINNIDKIKPIITTSYDTRWSLEEVNIEWQVNDNESGIRGTILPDGSIVDRNSGRFRVTQNGIYKFIVYDNVGNFQTKEVTINNIENKGPKIVLSMKPDWTPDIVEIKWKVLDADSGLKEVVLPNSKKSIEEEGTFTVSENGTYTFICYDNLGNMAEAEIEVNNIDKIAPNIELKLNTEEWTNEDINLEWEVEDNQSGVREIIMPNSKSTTYKRYSYAITENGEYTIIGYDNVGNQTTKKINISNIDKIKPIINLEREELEAGQIKITWDIQDNESGIRSLVLPSSEEVNDRKGTFIISKKGTYTFVVYDNAGNYETQDIIVD